MLQFMRNNRGALSIFTLFILIPVMVLSGLLIDFARAMAVRAQAASTAETYANSYLSMYDEMLNELYGLFAVTQSKDGTEALNQLEAYMKATYATDSVGGTQLNNSNALGLQDALKRVIFGSSDYSDALPLTGNAFSAVSTTVGKPLVNTANGYTDYDALQMQISEYIKFIGPTDLISSGIAGLIQPGNDTENKVAESNKNFKRIQQKQAIDDEITNLNTQITNMYNAMANYEYVLENYYKSIKNYSVNSINTYRDSIFLITNTYAAYKNLFTPIDNAGTASGYESQLNALLSPQNMSPYLLTNFHILICSFKEAYELELYDAALIDAAITTGEIANSEKTEEYRSYFTENKSYAPMTFSYYELVNARTQLETYASKMKIQLNQIKNNINALVQELDSEINALPSNDPQRKSLIDFRDGLKKDYAPILDSNANGTGDQRKMWVIANADYSVIDNVFVEESKIIEQKLIDDFEDVFDDNIGVAQFDDYLEDRQEKITDAVNDVQDTTSDMETTLENISKWITETDNAVTVTDEKGIYSTDYAFVVSFPLTNSKLSDYYTKFDQNNNIISGNITYKELYNTLKDWNTNPTEEEEKKKDDFNNITDNLWKAIKDTKFDNTKMRSSLENKIMPKGAVTSGDPNAEKTELKTILEDNPDGFGSVSAGTEYINKLMLMMYDYGMFTSQTSDKECDSDNMVKTIQPFSYQGIALAKSTGTDKYEASDTNFMLYGEMEYIFNGNADPKKNFNAVRNSLSMIRFVPNYISTYTIDEINAIINSIQTALSWCPLAAIVVTQGLRLAIAGFETWCDLDLLYGGHKVQFYKNSLGDLSLITKLETTQAGKDASEAIKTNFNVDLTQKRKASAGNIEISYSQYLIILQMLFVSRDDMIKRTADLIDTNMNYIKSGAITNDDGKSTVSITYSLTKANTAVSATCTVKNNFIFIGGVMNTDAAGYENASQLAKDNENKTYDYTVMREY